ncbi:uncharacterized mitochondrial protein AtMg00240-like [Rutidosis leptorrhynchoides]|uniref:uncharacterized mitochondrial protein AtMg00240-like n=1 Tax=Rutidosis leptorrhynchoides TaxID=125765 RepID=UPI003A98F4BD
MYLTVSRLAIMFATCLCARYQAHPNVNHMLAAKKIMHYLKGTPSLGLWYPRKDGFELTTYSVSNYGGCKRDFKSTCGGCQFLGSRLVNWQCKKKIVVAQSTREAEYIVSAEKSKKIMFVCFLFSRLVEKIASPENTKTLKIIELRICQQRKETTSTPEIKAVV